jgi:hypothetical protein
MKTKIIYLIMSIGLVIQTKAQTIPNGDFENWTYLELNDWKTNSCPQCDPPYNTYIVIQDSDACHGVYSAMFIYNKVYPAWAEIKFATTVHPINLYACIKSKVEPNDSATIDIMIYYNGEIVDEGHLINKSSISHYTNIIIPISQYKTNVDSIDIKITGGNKDSTILNADYLSFEPVTGIQEMKKETLWTLQPNPFKAFTLLKFNNPGNENHLLNIYNTSGQLVKTIENIYNDRVKIEKGNLFPGLYFFQLRNDRNVIASGKLIIE